MIISPSKIGKLPSCQHRGRMRRLMVIRTERSASIAAFLAQRSSPDASCSAEIASASWSALRGYARAKTPSEEHPSLVAFDLATYLLHVEASGAWHSEAVLSGNFQCREGPGGMLTNSFIEARFVGNHLAGLLPCTSVEL